MTMPDSSKFYTDGENSYQHLKYEDIENINFTNIINGINNLTEYNTHQIDFFDFVFSLNNTAFCITKSILEFYLVFRLHIVNLQLSLQKDITMTTTMNIINIHSNY